MSEKGTEEINEIVEDIPNILDSRPEDSRPEESRSEELRPEELRPEELRPEDYETPEESRPEESRPEDQVVRPFEGPDVVQGPVPAIPSTIPSVPQDIPESSSNEESNIQIQTTSKHDDEEGGEIYLGDRIQFESLRYGTTKGSIYYFDGKKLRVLPDGVSDRVYDFNLTEDGDWDPELGVKDVQFEPGPRTSFINLQGFREGQLVNTFTNNGTPYKTYIVSKVSKNKDAIEIQEITVTKNSDDVGVGVDVQESTGIVTEVDFALQGIPLDLPFAVIRIAPIPEERTVLTEEEIAAMNIEAGEFEVLGEIVIQDLIYVEKIDKSDIVYPEIVQKGDFLAELVTMIPIKSQQNPMRLKHARALVEMVSILKNSIIKRAPDGNVLGEQPLSLGYIADILKNRSIPLIRPVLTTARILQSDDVNALELPKDNCYFRILQKTIRRITEYENEFQFEAPTEDGWGADVIRWRQFVFGLLLSMGDAFLGTEYRFQKDGEFFRQEAPDVGMPLFGLKNIPNKEFRGKVKPVNLADFIQPIRQSLRRGLGPTMRALGQGGEEIYLRADRADVKSYVLFPYKTALSGALGTIRTGKLWDDILRSSSPKEWMEQILKVYGGIQEGVNAQSILHLDTNSNSNTLANIPFAEYLELLLQNIVICGVGDISTLTKDLGIYDMEIDESQQKVIHERIMEILTSLRTAIRQMRTSSEKEKPVIEYKNLLTMDTLDSFRTKIRDQPLLKDILHTMETRTPGYKDSDIAIVGTMLSYAPDYFMTTMGGDGRKSERERLRMVRNEYLDGIHTAFKEKNLLDESGQPPQVNPCEHVSNLLMIRKIESDVERFQLLAKFITVFRGGRDENWFTCNVCDKHLICYHEFIQIQQLVHPRDRDVLQKELVLSFAGGRFGNMYICRNCGIPLSEIDYDKNVEFDDKGMPMMGRSELVDKDAIAEEKMNEALTLQIGEEADFTFDTDLKNELYSVAKDIFQHIGITPESMTQVKLVERAAVEIDKRPSQRAYNEIAAQRRREGKPPPMDYIKYINIFKIITVASLFLIDIQTKIPDYPIEYVMEGCKGGFAGFPLIETADHNNEHVSTGVHYMACVLANIMMSQPPWIDTGWRAIHDYTKRKDTIKTHIINYIQSVLLTDSSILRTLERKREYLRQTFGEHAVKGVHLETVPSQFLPSIASMDSVSEGVTEEITSEGQNVNRRGRGDIFLANAWIRTMNKHAKDTARIIRNSPFSLTTCCISRIRDRHTYWNDKDFPRLPEFYRIPFPYLRQSWAVTPFRPPEIVIEDVPPPMELVYQIFLNLCWKGTRKGMPHEIGYDYVCDWCEIRLPPEYLFPDVDKYGDPIFDENYKDKVIGNLKQQGIPLSEEGFEDLIGVARRQTIFRPYEGAKPVTGGELVNSLKLIKPEPVEDWSTKLAEVLGNLESMKTNNTGGNVSEEFDMEIRARLQSLRNLVESSPEEIRDGILKPETFLVKKLPKATTVLMELLESSSISNIFEVMKTYLLIPSKRVLQGFKPKSMKVRTDFDLSRAHREVLDGVLERRFEFLEKFSPSNINVDKLTHFVNQLTNILSVSNEIRIQRLKFGTVLVPELMRIFLFGPLGFLLDSNSQFEDTVLNTANDRNTGQFIIRCIGEYKDDRMSYNKQAVQDKMTQAKEMEKQTFIDDMDKLSEEQRKVERIKQQLGLGRWAIGGTSLIYKYNKQYWDKTQEHGKGQYDVLGGKEGANAFLDGPEADIYGFQDRNTGDGEEGGYDVEDNEHQQEEE